MAQPSGPFNRHGRQHDEPTAADRALIELARRPPADGQAAEAERLVIQEGAEADAHTRFGDTPLHEAARNGNAVLVAKLLELGADPDRRNGQSATPLILAANADHADVARALLRGGATPDAEGSTGWTALMWAASRGNLSTARALLEGGAEAAHKSSTSNQTALPLAMMNEVTGLTEDHVRIGALLIEYGADLNAKDRFGKSAVDIAQRRGRADVAEYLATVKEKPKLERIRAHMTLKRDLKPMKNIRIRKPPKPSGR